ncbi:Fe-S cluster assembly protein SufD [Acidocella aquatica]|uniref:Fe-S cluster assembly protein SufD n=1 Tax=Acidocella aquatica TaxID=1922313 RepID=A0ABQ6A3P1_9PROT|nr:Fe-S cluster assembly protein SufD [Acidocella aquatica]GLR65880.1 Fe-S cluster assembly protein SufD [Acidocella aquatica]
MTALPTQRLESWRYTDLRALNAMSFAEAPAASLPDGLPDIGVPRLVFVNGRFDEAASSALPFARNFAAVDEVSDLPLARINAEHAHDGVTLEIPDGVDAGVVLLVSYANGGALHPRHRVSLGAGAALTLLEVVKGDGVYWHNPVTDIVLAQGASLAHYRLQDESQEAFHLATIRATVAADAAYESFTAVMGAKLSRAEFHVELTGAKAHTHLNAAQLLGGSQHGDFTSVVRHKAPDCSSRQTVKSVLCDSARGVFQGRIEVERVAQKTDGYQMSQALLLSPTAEMDIKPELQIYADDVKCSHGATIGALDEEQVFYLRSRGIPEDTARSMLIRAFLTEALEPVTHEGAHALFEAAIETWWARK